MPGIGNKTASQIILDLKGKLVSLDDEKVNENLSDVADALKALGYKQQEIRNVLKKLNNEEGSTDELIRKALSILIK